MKFGLTSLIEASASAGLSASPTTIEFGQLLIRRRSPVRMTTSASTRRTRILGAPARGSPCVSDAIGFSTAFAGFCFGWWNRENHLGSEILLDELHRSR